MTVAKDKLMHFTGSAIGANWLVLAGLAPLAAFAIMLLMGAVKETKDDNSMQEHILDMIANTAGAVTAFLWLYL